jgi:hypothetical protein
MSDLSIDNNIVDGVIAETIGAVLWPTWGKPHGTA